MTKKTETADTSLENLPKAINERLKRAEKYTADARNMRVSAGKLLLEAKAKVLDKKAQGEDVTWKGWVKANIERSYADCNKCIALMNAPDPAKAAQDERDKAKEGMAKSREKANGKASDIDPTKGMPEDKNPEKAQTAPNKEESPEKAVQEVDDILTDAEKLEELKVKIIYWVKNTATAEELSDLESYMSIPDLPKVEKVTAKPKAKNKPQPDKAKAKNRSQPDKAKAKAKKEEESEPDTSDIPEATEEDFKKAKLVEPKPKTAEESLKAAAEKVKNGNGKTPKIEDAVKEEDDDYVRPGLEGEDFDAGGKMPDFLKRG